MSDIALRPSYHRCTVWATSGGKTGRRAEWSRSSPLYGIAPPLGRQEVEQVPFLEGLLSHFLTSIVVAQSEALRSLSGRVGVLEQRVELLESANIRQTKAVALNTLDHPGLSLAQPMHVCIEHIGQESIASLADIDLFAVGACESDAVAELKEMIVELHYELKESPQKLGPLPRKWLRYLESVVMESVEPCS